MKPAFIIFTMLISNSALGQNFNLEWSTPYDEYFAGLVNKEDNQVSEIVVRLGTSPNYSYKIYDGSKYNVKYSFTPDLTDNTSITHFGENIKTYGSVDANNDGIYDMIKQSYLNPYSRKIGILDGRNGSLIHEWILDGNIGSYFFYITDIDNDGFLEICYYYLRDGDNIRHLSIFSTPAKVVLNYDNDDTLPDNESIQNYQNQVNPSPVIE